jgi:diguanylate cyclase (GGDEF)-like protein/PAS domain S-box-containing protein
MTTGEIRAVFEHSSDIVTVLDPNGRWRSTSPAGTRLLGWPPEYNPGPAGIFEFVHPDDRALAEATLDEVISGNRGPEASVVLRIKASDGSWRDLETQARDLRDDPAVHGIVITSRDVTERRNAEARVQLLSRVLETSNEVVVLCDPSGEILYTNDVAKQRFGIKEGAAPLEVFDSLFSAGDRHFQTVVLPSIRERGTWSGEIVLQDLAGASVPVAVTIQIHELPAVRSEIVSVIAHDISELKETQAQLEHQATHDPLTGLPNRALFQELGEQALARSNRYGTTVAVLFLDLDRFKPVNDSFGHTVGDELLIRIAARLRGSVRRGDVVARFGGDEFVVLCEHPAGQSEMVELARRLIAALSEPVPVPGATATVGASIGIAIGGGARVTIDTLIRDADAALYQAKEGGRGHAVLFGARVD